MTPIETLQKYGLKTDVKSVKERLYNPDNYFRELKTTLSNTIDGTIKAINAEDIVHDADLALLCEMAEKGERVEAWKAPELQAIEKAWELINHKLPENNAEIQLVRFAVRVAREVTKSSPKQRGKGNEKV